jgi:[NiFe] hydrogenase assembly HybE family chaperone
MKSPGDLGDHPRVLALIERFRRIDAAMRDLPVYNAKVAVEAIGFRPFGDDALLGVVLTPWFMNVTTLPIEPAPMDMAEIGKTIFVELPAGKQAFVVGGDEMIGLYKARSLHSPVLAFTLPGQARAEALRLLAILMTPTAAHATATSGSSKSAIDRRALLFGRRPVPTPTPMG